MFDQLIKMPDDHRLFGVRRDDGSQSAKDDVHMDAQSLSFYSDVSRFICSRAGGYGRPLSILDIGPRTGAGLALLRMLHHPMSYAAVKLDPVAGIDIDPAFEKAAKREYPDIEALTGDAFKLGRKFDIVMSSHTIEHVPDPQEFLAGMQSLARSMVIVACPFEETERIEWHPNTIGYHFLSRNGFHDMEVYRSNHWFNSLCVIACKRV